MREHVTVKEKLKVFKDHIQPYTYGREYSAEMYACSALLNYFQDGSNKGKLKELLKDAMLRYGTQRKPSFKQSWACYYLFAKQGDNKLSIEQLLELENNFRALTDTLEELQNEPEIDETEPDIVTDTDLAFNFA